jgi:hypothetical protein
MATQITFPSTLQANSPKMVLQLYSHKGYSDKNTGNDAMGISKWLRNPTSLTETYGSNMNCTIVLPIPNSGLDVNAQASWNDEADMSVANELAQQAVEKVSTKLKTWGKVGVGQYFAQSNMQLFNNIPCRTYDLTWECIPQNANDAKNLRNIISIFQYALLPGSGMTLKTSDFVGFVPTSVDNLSEIQLFKFPDVVKVKFIGLAIDEWLPCIITSFRANYSSQQHFEVMARPGAEMPPVMTISLSLTEFIARNKMIQNNSKIFKSPSQAVSEYMNAESR